MLSTLKNNAKEIVSARINKPFDCFSSNMLIGLAMLYIMFSMLSGLMVYKVVTIGPIMFPAGIIVSPIVYSLVNATTETYGYRMGMHMVWWSIITSFFFCVISSILSLLPSSTANHQAYETIFRFMPLIFIAGTIGNLVGMSINSYVISKLKIRWQGKHYWLRSIIAIWPGEIAYNLIAYPMMYLFKYTLFEVVVLIASTAMIKLVMCIAMLYFECSLVKHIKYVENIDIFDINVNYNPFLFKLSKKQQEKPTLYLVK